MITIDKRNPGREIDQPTFEVKTWNKTKQEKNRYGLKEKKGIKIYVIFFFLSSLS
jgi:hypothetical protein